MIEVIYNFIQNRELELIDKHVFPTHTLDVEIYNNFGKLESQPHLKKLCADNRISWGKTVNNLYFKIKTEK